MSQLSDKQIEQIAGAVLQRLGRIPPAPPAGGADPRQVNPAALANQPGVFPDIDSAVAAATEAQAALMRHTLADREKMIASIRAAMRRHGADLAREAHEETGLGRTDDKIKKNALVTEKTPGTEDLAPSARSGDHGLMLTEPAPFGVIGAITPTTNPTSTIICNSIGMLAAGNAVVFNVHPSAKLVSQRNVALLNEAIVAAGGPANLICTVAAPTIESAQALMKHPGIRLLVVTGGPAVVKVALASGKRAICAGPGNPPCVIDETADLEKAGRDLVFGASFDNNVICTDEKTFIAVERIADDLLKNLQRSGARVLSASEACKVTATIFTEQRGPRRHARVNRDMIGKNAGWILQQCGLAADHDLRLAVMDVPNDHPLVWSEQMMPIMPLTRVGSARDGIRLAVEAELGRRHTASMFSRNLDHLSEMARAVNCSIFVKNGPTLAGLGFGGEGHTSFSIASPTGEGLTRPRDFARYRRCTLVDHFRIV